MALGLVLLGPDWPVGTTELVCGDTVEQMAVREVLADMDTCAVAMGRASAAGTECFCSVRQTWIAPAYYLGLVPLMFIAAMWSWSRPTVRGMAPVAVILGIVLLIPVPIMAAYLVGIRMPTFVQTMAVFGPQFVFFGPSLFRADESGPVVPHEWSYVSTVLFWTIGAALFGALAHRVKSFRLRLALAVVFVAAVVVLVRLVVPLFGWRLLFEGL